MTLTSRSGIFGFVRPRWSLVASLAKRDTDTFLATARAFLALSSLLAIDIDPAFSPGLANVAYVLLGLYLIHSLLALISAWFRRSWMSGWKLHLIDILWVVCIPVFIQGATRAFYLTYPFVLFVLLAAAYRWGLHETLITASACITLPLIGAAVTALEGWQDVHLSFGELGFKAFAERAGSLLMTAYVVGYLGEQEGYFRAKASVIAQLTAKVHSETSLRETLELALGAILGIFGANRAALVVRNEKQQRVFLWQAERTAGTQRCTANWEELEAFQQQRYLFSLPGTACSAIRRPEQSTNAFELLTLGADGERLGRVSYAFPEYFLTWHQFTSLLVVYFTLGENKEWSGRLFLFDPPTAGALEDVRFLQDLVREAGPAVYTVYRLRRLRSRAGGMERARIARELHDGVIQTLIGVEMRMDVLLRRAAVDRAAADELRQLQRLLRREIINVRELMQQIKSLDLSRRTPLESLADLMDKFRRETGISVELASEPSEMALPPLVGREVLRIVGEALANVRKHSGARNVAVRFTSRNGLWKLVIEDDGRGFDFCGRLSQVELDATRRGPAVIRERVRSIGGQLTVESAPHRGARLEITIPQNAP